MNSQTTFISQSVSSSNEVLELNGMWTIENAQQLEKAVARVERLSKSLSIDCSGLERIDSAGALVLLSLFQKNNLSFSSVNFVDLPEKSQRILQLVQPVEDSSGVPFRPPVKGVFEKVGRGTYIFFQHLAGVLAFLGESFSYIFYLLLDFRKFRTKEFVAQLERTFVDALLVVLPMMFLIGIVVSYLFAIQLERYGGGIFVVDGVSLAMMRELSPIFTAIIIAGRSGSSFTAEIGSMKLNEELDAMKTMGISPMEVIVLPRLFALIIALPLLVALGDIVGIAGGMFIVSTQLDITHVIFLERLQSVFPTGSFVIGILKAPVFAAFIAMIGCRMGMTVENNARSVGIHTTSTVVQCIISVILINSAFAIFLSWLGL